MKRPNPLARRLSDVPLWRLIVALDDAERTVGANSPTARALSCALRERLDAGDQVVAAVNPETLSVLIAEAAAQALERFTQAAAPAGEPRDVPPSPQTKNGRHP